MSNSEYTEKQRKIISGEIPMESVNGYALRWLYQKALANNDEELVKRLEARRDVLTAEARERINARSRIRKAKIRHHEVIQWRQPKSNEYTEHQKKIVRGEIPYEDVHTNELIKIHQKAYNNGDYELSERLSCLITDRRADAEEKDKQYRKKYNKAYKGVGKFTSFTGFEDDLQLSCLDKALLMNFDNLDGYSEDRLYRILEIVKTKNDEALTSTVECLILYKKDPSTFYIVKDHWEAIDLIEELLDLPIRRPETWFCEEEETEEDG